MDIGEPVCVTFDEHADGEPSDLLYCEITHKARHGESYSISAQGCPVGAYVLGVSDDTPHEYYLKSGRYIDMQTARRASGSLPRVVKPYRSIKIEPLSDNNGIFDVLILYLTPERAMRIIQAHSYASGARAVIDTLGAASVCVDCTALTIENGIGLSFGCKGSRKHSGYGDDEVPLGIGVEFVKMIEYGLGHIPETRD
ncbi:MAG TPA: protein clustered with O-phosphoseryl-tRNA(Cys) synthetase [Methanosarcinaceae archaeon]|nr:protein clustered with O-phosphoseryl-tRNA(Cys) synthetase [Methanosarcinaceae archaeon]